MDKKMPCVMCGNESLRLEESTRMVDINGVATEVPFRIHWCESCGGEMALGDDLRFNARAMRQTRKKNYGMLTGEEVRQVRKRLGLNQEQAAKLFGGGPVAFSKYENDEITQSEAMDRLLWLVGICPELLALLAKRLNMTLPGEASITIDRQNTKFDNEPITRAIASSRAALNAFKGFSEFSTASNDQIYRPDQDSRPADRKAA